MTVAYPELRLIDPNGVNTDMSRVTHLPYGASEGMRRLKELL